MYGLEAIAAANGWMITVVGAGIVFAGLVLLATALTHMPKLLQAWDNRREILARKPAPAPGPAERITREPAAIPAEKAPFQLTPEQLEAVRYFRWITDRLGEPFSLPALLEQAEKRGIARPFSRLDLFLRREIIIEDRGEGRGFYRWNEGIALPPVFEAESD